MEFLWILLIIFIAFPPLGAGIGLFVGLVGLIVSPILVLLAYIGYRNMYDGEK